jgi:hypothetical protein
MYSFLTINYCFFGQARALGYIVVGVNEYYTSKKCPVCEDFVGQVDLRRLYCPKCKVFMHRDVMAGHNMCNIIQGHLLNQKRPHYLQPRDSNGKYPWEDSSRPKRAWIPKSQWPSSSSASSVSASVKRGIKRKAIDDDGEDDKRQKEQ